MSIRKALLNIIFSMSLLLALAGVFAYPWHGLSYLEKWRELRTGRIYHSARTSQKVVALTFDDGPDPRYTGTVLNILHRHHVKATFFLCGKMIRRYPQLARRIVAEGHVIGNHTETHPHLENLSATAARREMDSCENDIESVTGERTFLFRPPRGLWNRASFEDARKHGYSVILWSLAFDRQAVKDSHRLRDRVVRLAGPGDIILMHDGSASRADERAPTIRELDGILTGLECRGFRFATVPDLLHLPGLRPAGQSLQVARAPLPQPK
jgi:peptidoglycan/xylan/chitin deacetylase (PgdA/CDA1 family)